MNTTEEFNVSFMTTSSTVQPSPAYSSIIDIYEHHIPVLYVISKAKILLYIFGFPANVLSCILWLRSPLRHSSGCYFAALAVSDDIFLALSVVLELQNTWKIDTLNLPIVCEMFPVFYLAVQYLSPLLTLAFTVERYISIRFPLKRREFCTVKRAKLVIFCLAVFVVLVSLIQSYFWKYIHGVCELREEVNDFRTNWNWVTESTMFIIVPFLILIFNIIVIYTMRQTKKRVKKLYGPIPPRKRTANTNTLLVVSFYLIITTLPVSVTYILSDHFLVCCLKQLSYEFIENNIVWQRHLNFTVAREIVYLFGISHYAFNFILYLSTGRKFRRELKKLFRKLTKSCSKSCSSRDS
ncbi:G-protein coupled receptor daf-37-like [Mytilus edulis]|uniref:G-protein coupled receptor daf-37-like n=1 Tax=Mytilus edulis TaxID=6550 RepID=UPI0039EE6B5C